MKTTKDYLIDTLEDYVELLIAELDDCAPFAIRNGWVSTRAAKGEEIRDQLSNLKAALEKEKKKKK